MIENGLILEKYLILAVNNINGVNIKPNHINFKCNICGDGRHGKKRGHLLYVISDDTFEYFWTYKCFNEGDCQCAGDGNAWSGERWLKHTSPALYSQYVKEILQPLNEEKKKSLKEQQKQAREKYLKEKEKRRKENIEKEKDAVKFFIPISKPNQKHQWLIDKATKLCIERKIPNDVWNRWYVCYDGMYKNRLVIPFYSDTNEIFYYQCRSLDGSEPKYLNRIQDKDKALYNIHKIDRLKPVIIVEGVIDSLFIENSIAVLGLGISNYVNEELKDLEKHYLFDNDKAGKQRSKKLLKQGESVFLWNRWKYKDCKDINDIVIKYNIDKLTFTQLQEKFTTNQYDKLYLE